MAADADLFTSGFNLPDQLQALRAELRHGNVHFLILMAISWLRLRLSSPHSSEFWCTTGSSRGAGVGAFASSPRSSASPAFTSRACSITRSVSASK